MQMDTEDEEQQPLRAASAARVPKRAVHTLVPALQAYASSLMVIAALKACFERKACSGEPISGRCLPIKPSQYGY